jgi:hypothetical protein
VSIKKDSDSEVYGPPADGKLPEAVRLSGEKKNPGRVSAQYRTQ